MSDTAIGGAAVVNVLEELALTRSLPKIITLDNGPELTSKALHLWAQSTGVTLHHIQPGKPMQNAFIESFNGTSATTALTALLMPRWRLVGLAPAVTFFRPSR